MAIGDYIPNVFGANPSMYEGLLGAEDAANLTKQSNVAGLLGAAATLATGMGGQGPRRSALQNILGSLAAGYGTAGQAYGAGIEQMANAQKLAQMKIQMQQQALTQQAVNQALQDPRIANDPTLRAALLTDPSGFLKSWAENAPIQSAISGAPAAPQAEGGVVSPEAPMTVTASNRLSQLEQRRQQLLDINNRLSGVPGEKAAKQRDINNKDIDSIRKEIENLSTSGYDFGQLEKSVPEQLKPYVSELKNLAGTGGLNANELGQRIQAIQSAALELQKGQKYEGIVGQYANYMFGTSDASKLTPEQNKNILAYANAPTQADQTKIAIDAQRLQFETGKAPALPISREAMLGGVQAQPQPTQQPTQAPTIVPKGPIAPMAQPPAPKVAPELQRTGEVKPQPAVQQKVQPAEKITPLINQPDSKVSPKRKQEIIAAQPATIGLVNYTLKNVVDAKQAAESLLNNPAYIKALSGATAPAMANVPGTDAYTAKKLLDNLLGRSFITEIQQMRQASPTGGAVGSVAVQEMTTLSNIQSALAAGMKEGELRKQLKQYINSANRATKTIPQEYARTYGSTNEFDEILKGGVVQQGGLPTGVTVKRK